MINQILSEMRSVISAAYPSKLLLANPGTIAANTVQSLTDGFSVNMGSGSYDDYSDVYSTAMTRDIEIILTKGFKTTDLNASSRLSAEESLIEEMLAIIKAIKQAPELRPLVVSVSYVSDDGIKLVQVDKLLTLVSSITLEIRYKEIY